MKWQEEYKSKLASAEEAVRIVESGDRVIIPLTSQPRDLAQALAARGQELNDVGIVISTPEIDLEGFLSAGGGAFHLELEIFIGARARPIHDAGQAPFLPLPFSLSYKAVDQRPSESKPIDVVMVQVTPPDRHGLVSFGPHAWFKRGYARRARKVLAEVNPALIRPHGDCFLPVSSFDRFVEVAPPSITREGLLQAISSLPEERRAAMTEIIRLVSPERLAPMVPQLATIDPQRLRTALDLEEPPAEARAIADSVRPLIWSTPASSTEVARPSTGARPWRWLGAAPTTWTWPSSTITPSSSCTSPSTCWTRG